MASETRPVVGFIGLGVMGGPMTANLQRAGYPVVVNDVRREAARRHEEAGATWADTPRALAQQCDVVFSCLPTAAAIESVALGPDGVLAGIRSGCAYFEMSTSTPELVNRLHAAFAQRGAHLLDAPISGGGKGAVTGRLAIWAGGDRQAFDRFQPVLRAMGDHPVHVGAVGAGLVTKLVHNCTSQTTQAAIAEAFVLGVKAGAEPLALWQAIRQGAIGRRRVFDGLAGEFLPARFDLPGAPLRIMHKDMQIATALGRELGLPMRFANLALAELQEAMNRGWSERDGRCAMLLPQERAGVQVQADPAAIDAVLRRDPPAEASGGTGRAAGAAAPSPLDITVGFIGLGAMGRPMAANLLRAGCRLVVNDLRREAAAQLLEGGAAWADTPQAVAERCDVVFTCLPDLATVERVALGPQGVLAGIRRGAACFEMSTTTPELVRRLHAAFAERGAQLLDAPISGGARGAQEARLAIWVGGDLATYQRFEPVLRAMGDCPTRCGPAGAGLVTKVVHNCASQSTQAGIAEVFTLGVKAGADPLGLWEGVRTGMIGRRRTFDDLVDEFLPGNYDRISAPLRVVYKDMKSATGFGRELGVPMRFANLAFADIQEAMNRGWAEHDRRCVMLLPQERANLRVQVDPAAIQDVLRRDPPAPTDVKHGAGA